MSEPEHAVGPPDWDHLPIELHCPRCGYDLRRLPQPRCPECGLSFRWKEVINAANNPLSCPLFEYHWRDQPVRSALLMYWRALWPWRLWRDPPLAREARIAPLIVLLLIALAAEVLACTTADYAGFKYVAEHQAFGRYITLIPACDWELYGRGALGDMLVVGLTWLALQALGRATQRHRLPKRHLLRVLLLAALGFALWRTLSGLTFEGLSHLWIRFPAVRLVSSHCWSTRAYPCFLALPLVAFFVSVAVGLHEHLRVPRGWVLGLAAAVIVALLIFAPLLVLNRLVGPDNAYADVLWQYCYWPAHLLRMLSP